MSSSRAADAVSDEDLEAALRRRVELIYHPVGTCAMGDGETARWSTPSCGCAASRACAWWTPR